MNLRLKHPMKTAGDTIVEVLVALAALGIVLGTSAVIVSRSSRTMQTTQERSLALGVAQSQIERTKVYLENNPTTISTLRAAAYCLDTTNTYFVAANSACTLSSYPQAFRLSTTITGPTGTSAYYTLLTTVSWDTLSGTTTSTQLSYRIYQ